MTEISVSTLLDNSYYLYCLEQNMSFDGFSALETGDFGCIILYEDIIGRGYCTLYFGQGHYFSDIYPSEIGADEKRKIRSVIHKLGGTSDIAKIVHDNEKDFWQEIVQKQTPIKG